MLTKLKHEFRKNRSQSVEKVVEKVNPILRGWLNYFRIGHSSKCFGYVRQRVEMKLRRHMMRSRGREGFGWKRWSREEIQKITGIYNDYEIRYYIPKALPGR
ncbi:group II intron maturase-specific domain-containing protein [Kosmotoga sp. DU53]|uniref:group II intron maturase-specific domain-containing protein n=1 Tax=Kosmotoga sp. DU53 TaxID=1310160 RepID=UPI001F351338|nr:group II intron maturase-specific domain-containing protein [Kosmotoga sp. DU53]